jgi:DNA modification methylase
MAPKIQKQRGGMMEIKITCEGAARIPLEEIEAFQGKLKKLTKGNLEKLKKRIIRDGINVPVFIWKHEGRNKLLDGHQRQIALKSLAADGWHIPPVPVAYIEADNEADARQKLLGITSSFGEFELDELENWVAELDADIADSLRFADEELKIDLPQEEIETEGDDEFSEDAPERSKLGDIWELNGHRVMCGDSTNEEYVKRLMNGSQASMVFTDPPYGVNIKGGNKGNKTIASDLTQIAIPFSFDLAVKIATKEKAKFYFCGGETNISLYGKLFDRFLRQLPRHLIWVKDSFVMKPNNYHNQYEIIYFGYKEGGGSLANWQSGRTEDEASDVWRIKRDNSSDYLHPTQKPIQLPMRAIKNSSKTGELIYEPFLGSGSTLIASEKTNRICYGMELDPHYIDVIIQRWKTWMEANEREYEIKLNGEPVEI